MHTTEEFGDSVHLERLEQHDNYVNEVISHSKALLKECEFRAKDLGIIKIFTMQEVKNCIRMISLLVICCIYFSE